AAYIATRVPAGGGVALHLPNSQALALFTLATARAGREAQVLDPDWPAATVDEVLAALAPGLIVTADLRIAGPDGVVLADPTMPFLAVADALGAPERHAPVPEPAGTTRFYVGFTS